MCVVSMVGDHYNDKWGSPDYWRKTYPTMPSPWIPHPITQPQQEIPSNGVSKEEFNALKREVEEMKELLKRAVDYDKRNNEPHCEMEEKVSTLKKVAEIVGVDLKDVFAE